MKTQYLIALVQAASMLVTALAWIALSIMVYVIAAAPARADGVRIEPLVLYQHTSDLMQGPPFLTARPGCEPTMDTLAVGATLRWKRVELDLAHGVKMVNGWCGSNEPTRKIESGTIGVLRWYPWRKR